VEYGGDTITLLFNQLLSCNTSIEDVSMHLNKKLRSTVSRRALLSLLVNPLGCKEVTASMWIVGKEVEDT